MSAPSSSQPTEKGATRQVSARREHRGKRLTDEQYDARMQAQQGRCAIDGCPRTPKTRRFHVDHDHATGLVRGLLCHWHNRILPKTSGEAYAMGDYLFKHEEGAREQDATMLACPRCGDLRPPASRHCPECGVRLTA